MVDIVESATRKRLRELAMMTEATDGPDSALDRQIGQVFGWYDFHPTHDLDHAKVLIKKYRQFGFRQYLDGTWGAYVEVDSWRKDFIWSSHRSECNALVIAALKVHIEEMT